MQQSFFEIFGFKFYFYGILIGLSIVLLYLTTVRKSADLGVSERDIFLTFIISLPLALIVGRIYHILDLWNFYKENWKEIFNIWNGGLGIYGALIGGFMGIYISSKMIKKKLLYWLDLISPQILLSQSIGRLGNFCNIEGYGVNNLPVFLIESILCSIAFILFILMKKRIKFNGFAYYLVSYGLIRLITESLRSDTWRVNGLKIAYLFSIVFIITGLIVKRKYS